MAESPSHKFGQIIGNALEEILLPELEKFCRERGLYLDRKGSRGGARAGNKVCWEDKYGNLHDLDFVIERGGTKEKKGRPLAFIEAAWRRYTKHSRNKAQEIQGAVLPIAEQYGWDRPFLGCILAGIFTEGALTQLRSVGFEVLYIPYSTIVAAFRKCGIDVQFDETTSDAQFSNCVRQIEVLSPGKKQVIYDNLVLANRKNIDTFLRSLASALDRMIESITVIPLHGQSVEFRDLGQAKNFVRHYAENQAGGSFHKYEIIVKYSNNDRIDATFEQKEKAIKFLEYVAG